MITANDYDNSQYLSSKIKEACSSKTPLQIVSGNSKNFYGRKIDFEKLDISSHSGIINYEPSELVMTVRAGTSLSAIQSVLDENNQKLAFEPPDFNSQSSIGGTIACGLSGSSRPFAGSARDFVLGTRVINGKGEQLRFGGEVIKNVAGYDVSRLMTGALGSLGVLLDISIKVLPRPESEITLVQALSTEAALTLMTHLKRQALPISGLVYCFNHLFIRLSGSEKTINKTRTEIGGEILSDSSPELAFSWKNLDNQTLSFFKSDQALWRISVKPNTPILNIDGECIYGWCGAERWIISDNDHKNIFKQALSNNGHATLFRFGHKINQVFQPLPRVLLKIHMNLKKSFDPENILNPGKLYSEI